MTKTPGDLCGDLCGDLSGDLSGELSGSLRRRMSSELMGITVCGRRKIETGPAMENRIESDD